METQWEQTAQKLWLASTPKPDPEALIREIWSPLQSVNFAPQSLLVLENLQIVEKYLWLTFSNNAPNQHVILLAAFVNTKRQGHLPSWSLFADRPDDFSVFFHRTLSLNLDASLPIACRLIVLNFVIGAFQSLERELVRKECAPLVSIAVWHNLHSEAYREKQLQKSPSKQKAWRASQKRFDAANKEGQVKIQFERAWLYSMVLDFLRRAHADQSASAERAYCEKFLEFLIDLISQLPTRRYSIILLKDLNVLSNLRISKLYKNDDNTVLRDLTELYKHFLDFGVDEAGGNNSGDRSTRDEHYSALAELQRTAFKHFESKLKVLSLSNYASIDSPGELRLQLSTLSDVELEKLCEVLDFRTAYAASAAIPTGRTLFLEILVLAYARPRDFRSTIRHLSVSPTESMLYDHTLLRNEIYDGSQSLALPKLNLQYLSLDDFMWRSFQLHQTEAFYEIRKDMESIVRRMKPRADRQGGVVQFEGFSKMAMPIDKPAVIEVGPPSVGSVVPKFVRCEVILDLSRLNDRMRHDWESLRPKDVVFLMAVKSTNESDVARNGAAHTVEPTASGLHALRTAEVIQILDDNGKPLRDAQVNGYKARSRRRRLLLNLDTVAFRRDQVQLANTKVDVLSSINVIARRQSRENNFKPVLETIQKLVGSQADLPAWLQEVFLGYGDPNSASPARLQEQIERLDFADTFLDWAHLQASLPGRIIAASEESSCDPPYVLAKSAQPTTSVPSNPKKRRREQMEADDASYPFRVNTYKRPNVGPYPDSALKQNTIRFTPKQISAIMSGVQPGLTVVVGPPGTGKTDVATQIIDLLYNNFPTERILLVAHSNQALNQLFQKIINRNIDARHLLRLGHGEEELDTEVSYSKYGRVESFMENRQSYLGEVARLAVSLGIEGAHGSTCETADYFDRVYIRPAWAKFWSFADNDMATAGEIVASFPFTNYFSTAPVPELFPHGSTVVEVKAVAEGCQYHLTKIFKELGSIRPFEVIRNPKDQANHLLVKEARIIAMTSTHAAMRRSEIAELGFRYDTLIMEEAAQITEIESFIPCAMQNPDSKTSELPLKRIVLVGDHLQNSPVVQNLALRQYANFEQSLFLRLVRLGVPTITLDQQGRCRPSIAELFNWRYDELTNLPHLTSLPEFARANAGFRHEFQFIDVPDYQSQGEREPTPHFIQNLGEAEYAVALYQYMRLLGYPARSISVLTTYAGQKALIRDVLEHRCKGNRLFGMPKIVTTVDKYQGEQNDYVILSMVRTKSVGYLRDVRRLTVALSRARLGLYVLGRRALFETCLEMKPAMDQFINKSSDQLELVTGEMFPAQRTVDQPDGFTVANMDGVEHLGQYVYEMTQAKVKALGGTVSLVGADGIDLEIADAEDAAEELAHEVDLEEDPLHENV